MPSDALPVSVQFDPFSPSVIDQAPHCALETQLLMPLDCTEANTWPHSFAHIEELDRPAEYWSQAASLVTKGQSVNASKDATSSTQPDRPQGLSFDANTTTPEALDTTTYSTEPANLEEFGKCDYSNMDLDFVTDLIGASPIHHHNKGLQVTANEASNSNDWSHVFEEDFASSSSPLQPSIPLTPTPPRFLASPFRRAQLQSYKMSRAFDSAFPSYRKYGREYGVARRTMFKSSSCAIEQDWRSRLRTASRALEDASRAMSSILAEVEMAFQETDTAME